MAYANLYRPDRLFLPQQRLTAFAETVPTPFYLYHEEGIRKSAQLICGSFRWALEHLALFPISANSCPQVLRIFREAGFGALARSVQELALARSCGFSEIAFHTAAMTPEAVRAVKDAPCTVIFDSPAQIEAMEGRFPARCALRYHPEKEPGRSAAAVLRHKSGMDRAQILDAVRILSAAGVEEIGLHCHIDGNPGEEFYPAAADMAFSLAQEVFLGTGIRFAFVDPGGGIGLRREADRGMVQLSRVGALVRDRYEARFGAGYRPAIWTEFGRCAVARHGLLICRVTEIRERTRAYAILDASTGQLPDLLLGGARHPISVVGTCSKNGRRVYSVHGCTPDVREILCDRAILPVLSPGKLLAIRDAGAYCESMQIPRCMGPACGSYLYTEDGSFVPTA